MMEIPTVLEAQQETEATLARHFPRRAPEFLRDLFAVVEPLFGGRHPGFQACDCPFHDLAHTLEATQALTRLLDGHVRSGAPPALHGRDFELAVAGILLHDSGYLKETGDTVGSGAKFTPIHVGRSAALAARYLPALGVLPDELRVVQLAIHSTAADVNMARLAFRDERERFIGCALGTADILGQMAAVDYPERLPGLYREFAESALLAAPDGNAVVRYASAKDLMRRTRGFYTRHVRRMLDLEWNGVHRAYVHHFPDGQNQYFTAIETNLDRIDQLLTTAR